MKRNRGATIGFGIIFGFIAYAITVFLFPPKIALTLGIFTAAVYILVLSIVTDLNLKKYKSIDMAVDQDVVLKDTVNYYGENLIVNGILYLTADRLIFISFEKKPPYREEILLSNIKRATYGKITKYISGLKLFMADSTVKGFVLKDIEPFLDHINRILTPDAFDDSEKPE